MCRISGEEDATQWADVPAGDGNVWAVCRPHEDFIDFDLIELAKTTEDLVYGFFRSDTIRADIQREVQMDRPRVNLILRNASPSKATSLGIKKE
jgi:hypothetical protein